MLRFSYLFDEIPFGLEVPLNRSKIAGAYEILYHDEKIDWGALLGWEVPSTKLRPHDIGLLFVGRATENSNHLEGKVFFIPSGEEEESEEYSEADESISDRSAEEVEGSESDASHLGMDDNEDDDEEQHLEAEEVEGIGRNEEDEEEEHNDRDGSDDHLGMDDNEDDDEEQNLEAEEVEGIGRNEEDEEEEHNDRDESDDGRRSGSEIIAGNGKLIKLCSFLHFGERHFVCDSSSENASWYRSGSACDFGLINPQSDDDDDNDENDNGATEGNSGVTLFRVNESMAFERGDQQRFVSLEDPCNYGTECGSHYDRVNDRTPEDSQLEDDSHRIHVMERMQAYRGSWIRKLPPSDILIPDDVVHVIWNFWQTGPPPFLFVRKGDLLLLARCEETVPDPDGLPVAVTVTREHLILAHPSSA